MLIAIYLDLPFVRKSCAKTHPKKPTNFGRNLRYTPQNKHGTWKWTLGKGDSYWKPPFPGSMLIFGGCIWKNQVYTTLQLGVKKSHTILDANFYSKYSECPGNQWIFGLGLTGFMMNVPLKHHKNWWIVLDYHHFKHLLGVMLKNSSQKTGDVAWQIMRIFLVKLWWSESILTQFSWENFVWHRLTQYFSQLKTSLKRCGSILGQVGVYMFICYLSQILNEWYNGIYIYIPTFGDLGW